MTEIPWYKKRVVFFEPFFALLSIIGGFFWTPFWLLAVIFVLLTAYEMKKS